jgi:outer membrane lipoprotein-sorting protein
MSFCFADEPQIMHWPTSDYREEIYREGAKQRRDAKKKMNLISSFALLRSFAAWRSIFSEKRDKTRAPCRFAAHLKLFLLSVMALAGGCAAPPAQQGYYGPTLPLDQVVARIDENNARIPTLWAREHFEGTLVDREKKKTTRIDGYGNLLYTSPNEIRLTAKNEFTEFFQMGSDGRQFWFWDEQNKIFWWGDYSDVGQASSADVPVRPDMVMEMLGIRRIDPSLLDEPAPTLRFNVMGDAYMIDWQSRSGGRWVVLKEIWYDRQTLLPEKALLFDGDGHVVVWALLGDYRQVEIPGAAKDQWPTMASRYELFFPYTGSTISFTLSDMSLSYKGHPNAATYQMPVPATLNGLGVRVNHIE